MAEGRWRGRRGHSGEWLRRPFYIGLAVIRWRGSWTEAAGTVAGALRARSVYAATLAVYRRRDEPQRAPQVVARWSLARVRMWQHVHDRLPGTACIAVASQWLHAGQ